MAAPGQQIVLRLIHDGVQPGAPLAETLRFGLQDSKGTVVAGEPGAGGVLRFAFPVTVKNGTAKDGPVLSGPFCQGPPAARFVYLSWKREGEHAAPYGWRIKMPLGAIDAAMVARAEEPGLCIEADVRGRRPHAVAPVPWRVAEL